MNARNVKADLLLLVTALIWGSAFVAQRMGMEHIGPATYNGIRFALGGACLLPVIRFISPTPPPGPKAPSSRTYLWGGLLAGAALFCGASLQQYGIVTTTAGKAGFITGLYVVMVPLLGLLLGQRPGWGTWAGAFIAVAGLFLLSVTGPLSDLTMSFGDTLVLIGAVFWSIHVLVLGWLSPRMDPVRLACMQFFVCSVLSLALGLATEPWSWAGTLAAGWAIAYGGVMSVGIAYTLQVVAQRDAPPAHAAIILSLETVFAALAGWALLAETMDARALVGCGLMLSGMLLSQLKP